MKKIILTKGLPGSGKTTWAKEYQSKNPNTILVNKDDLRGMLHQNIFSKGREAFVLEIRNAIIIRALEEGQEVIVHDTNLHPKHYLQMQELVNLPAFKGNVEIEIKDFTNIPLEQCIKQDLKRHASVGEKVIRDMYKQFLKPEIPVIEYDPILPDAIICDIDGTLALFGKNNPYERDFLQDEVNIPVRNFLYNIERDEEKAAYTKIILISGRMGKFVEQTKIWLAKNGIPYDMLLMRKEDDMRKDSIIKQEIYENNIKGKYNIRFVLDDRNQVVELWRSLGLACFQVAEGDF